MTSWTDTAACQSRQYCRPCRSHPAFLQAIAARYGSFTCPIDPGHAVDAALVDAAHRSRPESSRPPRPQESGGPTDAAWDTFVATVRAHGSPRLRAELTAVLERLPALCACSAETLKQRFMGNHPVPPAG